MKGYPVMLDLSGKNAVVVGGGKIATRKVQTLLESEAKITVVSPEITETLEKLVNAQQIIWIKKYFQPGDLAGACIVIAATDDKEVNRRVAANCLPNQLVNVASEAAYGNFIVPASLRRGRLTISVSTDGENPSIAKQIRDELSRFYDESYANYVDHVKRSDQSGNKDKKLH